MSLQLACLEDFSKHDMYRVVYRVVLAISDLDPNSALMVAKPQSSPPAGWEGGLAGGDPGGSRWNTGVTFLRDLA